MRVKNITIFILVVINLLTKAWAALPVDIVFDLDQTILTLVHEGPKGDLLADPSDPLKGTITIEFFQDGKIIEEVWDMEKISPGKDLIQKEKQKFSWIEDKILKAIDKRVKTGKAFSSIIQDMTGNGTITPLQKRGCPSTQVFKILEELFQRWP
jgi:hypothetical protein